MSSRCSTFCGNPEYSVFIGGGAIANVVYRDLEEWLRGITDLKFTHIQKVMRNTYGHVHFDMKEDASVFYHAMKGRALKGPKGCTIYFRPTIRHETGSPVEYKDDENQPPHQDVEIQPRQRKRRAEEYLVDHRPMSSKTQVPYRIYEDSASYTVVVNTPTADEDRLVLTYGERMVSLAWNYLCKVPSTFTLVEDHIPAALATDIRLPERIEKKSVIVNVENGVTKLILKKWEHV